MHRLKLKYKTSISNCACMSSSSGKRQSHYETLKVKSNATQNEIKSAYYELSKKYHPDLNKTENAKESFRKVSEAYEILGNHTSRRDYDRIMSIRGSPIQSSKSSYTYSGKKPPPTSDPRMRAYRQEAESYGTGANSSKAFNYDTWTQIHYGKIFHRSQKLKKTEFRLRNEMNIRNQHSPGNKILDISVLGTLVIFFGLLIGLSKFNNFDEPKIYEKIKKKEEDQ